MRCLTLTGKMALICGVLWVCALPVRAWGEGPLRIIRSDAGEIILELSVAAFQVQDVEHEGVTYHRISIPDFGWMTDVGRPQLPVRSVMVGVPEGTRAAFEILAADYQTLPDYRPVPVPRPEVNEDSVPGAAVTYRFARDGSVYDRDALYPSRPAAVGLMGRMRGREVVQILFHPIRINPAKEELRFYNRILVRVGFEGEGAGNQVGPPALQGPRFGQGDPYERLIEDVLLNYREVGGGLSD